MATHLVLLHHGWQGHPRGDFTDDFVHALTNSSPASTLIHNVSVNYGLDSEGVHACAERLCNVIELLKHDNPALQSITMIGVSFGGIVLRYTAAQLFDGQTSLMCGLKPDSFVSIATPHIGATLPALYAAATGFASLFVTVPTLKQLRMNDDANDPVLLQMTTDSPLPFMTALGCFDQRICIANSIGDTICSYATAAIVPWIVSDEETARTLQSLRPRSDDAAGCVPDAPDGSTVMFARSSRQALMVERLHSMKWIRYDLYVPEDERSLVKLGAHLQAASHAYRFLLDNRVGWCIDDIKQLV